MENRRGRKPSTDAEQRVFAWAHSLLAYGLNAFLFGTGNPQPIVALGAFLFSSLMCRRLGAGDLRKMLDSADVILNKMRPRQKALDIDDKEPR